MVVSCFGAWCSQANPVFSFISKAAAHRRSWHPDLATIFLRQRLSVALQRQNALTLAKHYCVSDLEGCGPDPSPVVPEDRSVEDAVWLAHQKAMVLLRRIRRRHPDSCQLISQ